MYVPQVLIGAQVGSAGGPLKALARGRALNAEVIQIFTQSPRMWRSVSYAPEELAAYEQELAIDDQVRATFCHATYLVNLATRVEELAVLSQRTLLHNLVVATAIGSSGLVLHVGSHRGTGFADSVNLVAERMLDALDRAQRISASTVCPLLLENTAGAGGTMGRTFEELAALLSAASNDERLGFCIDTQHLFASGIPYRNRKEADAVVSTFDDVVGLDRLACLHLNDSKVPLGANRDRHENLGEGEIGKTALGWLISHPRLDQVPAILEVPGSGKGPRAEDLATARSILAAGRNMRASRRH